ncbi:MAG: ECF transporter S component [Clostridia bacterium]|nr:ECF transporter S component [Clostridia bacterium]
MKTTKRVRQAKTLVLTQNAVLASIVVLMAFTPVGYLRLGAVEMTFIMIPVAVGAITLGEKSGAFLGLVFGISSFVQCFGMSPFGAALLQINPIYTFIMCLVPRVLMGYLCGVIYKLLTKHKKGVAVIIASFSAPVINTILFIASLMIFFGKSDFILGMRAGTENLMAFLIAFVGLNGVMEIVTTTLIAPPVAFAVEKAVKKFK